MKKTLIAGVLFAALFGTVQAETQVTLYGIVDLGIGYQRLNTAGASLSKFGMSSGNQSRSRFGLRGTEDLGNGTRVVFTLESGFNANNGKLGQSARLYPGGNEGLFGRQATVGLVNDAWGQLDLGRQTNIASKYFASIDPFGAPFGLASMGYGFSSASETRYDNMVMYQTPSFAGFQLGGGYSFNTGNTSNGGYGNLASGNGFSTNHNNRAITAGLRYVNGPLALAAAYDQINPARNQSGAAGAPGDGADKKIRSYMVGGSFDFEVVKLALAWGQTRNGWLTAQNAAVMDSSRTPLSMLDYRGNGRSVDGLRATSYLVGVTVPMGAVTHLVGSWQRVDPSDRKRQNYGKTSNSYSLGLTYDLSKRTNLYALGNYTTNYAFRNDVKVTTAIVGMRHRF